MPMRRSRRATRVLGSLLSAIWLAGCPAASLRPAQAPREPAPIRAQGTWRHEPSGLEFPERVGSFFRVAIHQFDEAGNDVGVGYNRIGEGTLIVFTVYVFPPKAYADPPNPSATALQFHYERDGIRAAHQGVTESWSRAVTFDRDDGSIEGSAAEFRYPERFADATTTVVSQLYLFQWARRCVKYRVSFPASHESIARPAVEAFLANAPWGRVAPD